MKLPFLSKAKEPEKPAAEKDPLAPEEREKLPAEHFFDKAVYGGISYAAQAGTGIVLSHWIKHGSGKHYFDKAAQWLGPKLFSSKPAAEAIKMASTPIIVTTMIMVGNTFLIPVKLLENKKPQIVRYFHERGIKKREASGEVVSAEEKAHHEESLKQLEQEPKQTWGSLLGGRAFGLGVVYAAMFAMGKNNEVAEKYSAKTILKGMDKVGLKSLAKSKVLDQYLQIGFVDVFYSAVSTAGLYVYSHFLNPPKDKDKAVAQSVSPVADAPQPEAEVPAQKNFADSIKPVNKLIKAPDDLYTGKLAREEQAAETHHGMAV